MPWKCCVPGCKSNYDSKKTDKYVPVFSFPKDEQLRDLWLRRIPRKEWTPGVSARVCELHFETKFISKYEDFTDKDGNHKTYPRKRSLLLPNAVPSIFRELPKYLSSTTLPDRTDPAKRRKLVNERFENRVDAFLSRDIISNFEEFVKSFDKYVNSSLWKAEVRQDQVIIYVIHITEIPKIIVSVKINFNMNIIVCKNGFYVNPSDLKWLFLVNNGNVKLERWSQFENLLNRYAADLTEDTASLSLNTLKQTIVSSFEKIIQALDDADDNIQEELRTKMVFQAEQCSLAFESKMARRYSTKMVINSFLIYFQSPAAYQSLKTNNLLTLPHTSLLMQLTRQCEISADNKTQNEHFLKMKCGSLSERERYVVLQLDEIYLKKKIEYKCGKLYGYAENLHNSLEAAKTILAFLISSPYGSFKSVAALRPVNKLTSTDLTQLTQQVCQIVISCGFKIIVIVSDNNRINRSLFSNLSISCEPPQTVISDEYNTFLTFDSVHILKTIRNNWLNQKDIDKTFVYPSFTNPQNTKQAKFSVLRDIYKTEANLLLKTAPKLNFKTVFPSNIERQKVSLAINVFDESTIAAVKLWVSSEEDGTVTFLQIINQWWTIMNIKDTFLHVHKRKSAMKPFEDVSDERLIWLCDFLKWLEQWKPVQRNFGFLTIDTYSALHQQTSVMIEFIKYSLTNLKVDYVLTGKIQTDALEKCFSRYRSLSGNNYNVSVVQVLESEKKLRMIGLLGLTSARYGKVSFSTEINQLIGSKCDDKSDNSFMTELEDYCDFFEEDFEEIEFLNSVLIFVSGYTAFKIKKNINCSYCLKLISCKDTGTMTDEYFNSLNRGGLTVPSNLIMSVGKLCLCIIHQLTSPKFEALFVTSKFQKKLMTHLAKEGLFLSADINPVLNKHCCKCGVKIECILHQSINTFTNILLNNFSKIKNDVLGSTNDLHVKRKLSTLAA